MITIVLLIISWFGVAILGIWLYGGLVKSTRWWEWPVALGLGWFWLLPIGLYPFLKSDGTI